MRELGIEGESGRRRTKTTIIDKGATAASDHVKRGFNPPAPNVKWCGDITYLHTGEGWLYLATVIDSFSRRVIGRAAADHMRSESSLTRSTMAVATRGGHVAGVVFHSDHGSVYTSRTFGELCDSHGVVQSMGATRVYWDNSIAESWFGTMKRELAHLRALGHSGRRPAAIWFAGPRAGSTRGDCTHRTTTTAPSTGRTCTTVAVTASPHNPPVRRTGANVVASATELLDEGHGWQLAQLSEVTVPTTSRSYRW